MTELEKIKERSELRAKLISGAAHSLRTTMTNIRWTLELFLAGDLGPLAPEQKEYLKKLGAHNESAIRLLTEILNIIHAEELEEKKETEEINPTLFIEKIIDQFGEIARKKNLEIIFKKPEPITLKTEPQKLEFIVSNLLDNALRYSDKGKIIVAGRQSDKNLEISIKDEGIGIPAGDKDKVFDKFFRSENAKKKEYMGTGLGLHITKEIVESLGGKIWFESEQNTGTTFYFTLPIV